MNLIVSTDQDEMKDYENKLSEKICVIVSQLFYLSSYMYSL